MVASEVRDVALSCTYSSLTCTDRTPKPVWQVRGQVRGGRLGRGESEGKRGDQPQKMADHQVSASPSWWLALEKV